MTKIGQNEEGLCKWQMELLLCSAREMSVRIQGGSKLFSIVYSVQFANSSVI